MNLQVLLTATTAICAAVLVTPLPAEEYRAADSQQLLSSVHIVERARFSDNALRAGRRHLPVVAGNQDKAVMAWRATRGATPYHEASTTDSDAKPIDSTSDDRPTDHIVESVDLAFASLNA